MSIAQLSISASVMIIAVVIIRVLALHKLPKRTFIALWGLVCCRLLLPFSIPSSLSIFTFFDKLKQLLLHTTSTAFPMMSENAELTTTQGLKSGLMEASPDPLTIIWLIGMCVCALLFIAVYINCLGKFRDSKPFSSKFASEWLKERAIVRNVQLKQNNKIKSPLTYGIFRPVILMPKIFDADDEAQLAYILAHEFVHIRRFDTLFKLILTAVLCVHWFNPLVWLMFVLANRDIEISCDEAVVHSIGENARSAYAMMLIGMEERKSVLLPLCNNFSKNAIEERIVSIMKIKKTSLAGIIIAFSLIVGTTTIFATNAMAAKSTDEPLSVETTVNYGTQFLAKPNSVASSSLEIKDAGVNDNFDITAKETKDAQISLVPSDSLKIKQVNDVIYHAQITLKTGEIINLGKYSSLAECDQAVKSYCDGQVKAGKMTQTDADDIVGSNRLG